MDETENSFYRQVPLHRTFDEVLDESAYVPLPEDWFVGVADIVGSTKAIEAGDYKIINTVGAAVISAQINGATGAAFPFVFGGDGAAFAFWSGQKDRAAAALAAVARWADHEFGLELRVAIVPVSEIRNAGFDIAVARYGANENVDYAMFGGGGITWAESQMKAGLYRIDPAPVGTFPNLEGLSCRWTPMQAKNGKILSLLVLPQRAASLVDVADVMHEIVTLVSRLERAGHPVAEQGPGYKWPPEGLDLEARASHGKGSLLKRKLELLIATFLALIFFKTGWKAGEFDPKHYTKTVGANADFRKFEDGLKMTIDCDDKTHQMLSELLRRATKDGLVRYGLFEQNEAIMTCIVPSITSDDHVHFVDGASGGYAKAASMIKAEEF